MKHLRNKNLNKLLIIAVLLLFCGIINAQNDSVVIEKSLDTHISLEMIKISGDEQVDFPNETLSEQVIAKVININGNGVEGININFDIEAPVGAHYYSVSPASAETDENGNVETTVTLGDETGYYNIQVSCPIIEIGNQLVFSSIAVEFDHLIVEGATHIPGSSNYTVGESDGENVNISAILNPDIESILLPDNFVNWTNGIPGENQLERIVPRDESNDITVTAYCGENEESVRIIIRKSVVNSPITYTDLFNIIPSYTGSSFIKNDPEIIWEPVNGPDDTWIVNIISLNCGGVLNIFQWPNYPNLMIVPNTPNPVINGNINNIPTSNNFWDFAISDLQNYDTPYPNGGAGPHWHDTMASSAHEYYHKDIDWFTTCFGPAGGDWIQTEIDLEIISVSALTYLTQTDAQIATEDMVDTRFQTFIDEINYHLTYYIAPFDEPGLGGGGYAAGMTVLNMHINDIDAFRISQGW